MVLSFVLLAPHGEEEGEEGRGRRRYGLRREVTAVPLVCVSRVRLVDMLKQMSNLSLFILHARALSTGIM